MKASLLKYISPQTRHCLLGLNNNTGPCVDKAIDTKISHSESAFLQIEYTAKKNVMNKNWLTVGSVLKAHCK